MKVNQFKIIFILIIITGIFLRFYHLDYKIYWHDEVYTSLRVSGYNSDQLLSQFFHGEIITTEELLSLQKLSENTPLSATINSLIQHPEHPPLYYLLLRFWQDLFNNSSILFNRSLSLIFSLLALPTIYFLAKELFAYKYTSIVSTILVTVSPVQILYAQEAREYSLWMWVISLSILFLFKALKTNYNSHWYAYSLTLATNFYTSILSVFLPIVNLVYLILLRRCYNRLTREKFLIFTAVSGILFIPWIVIIILNFHILKEKTNWTLKEESLSFLSHLWGLHFSSLFTDLGLPLFHWLNYLVITLTFALIIYSFSFLIRHTEKEIWLYLLLLLIIPTLSLILPDIIIGGVRSSHTRYFFPAYIAVYLTIAYTVSKKIESRSKTWLGILVSLIIISIISNIIGLNSETWWNKAPSYHNAAIAKIINQSENPLVITEKFDINEGNIISLSHKLKPKTSLQLLNTNTPLIPHPQFKNIYVFNPSPELIKKIEHIYQSTLDSPYPLLYHFNPNQFKNSDK